VEIELVLRLVRVNSAPQKSPSNNTDPTARNYPGNLPATGSAQEAEKTAAEHL
jgi:hypothetical protein